MLLIDRAASVQFGNPFMFRVTRVYDWMTYNGWVWLAGYQLDQHGNAIDKRDIFVQLDGLKHAALPPAGTPRGRLTR